MSFEVCYLKVCPFLIVLRKKSTKDSLVKSTTVFRQRVSLFVTGNCCSSARFCRLDTCKSTANIPISNAHMQASSLKILNVIENLKDDRRFRDRIDFNE